MRTLSLFDGICCGQFALELADIPVEVYYASEIDKHAMQITQKNYPNTVQLGDANNWQKWDIDFSKIDLLIGGSPCQGFSINGKLLNFKDERSKLFFIFADILKHIKKLNPNIKFLFENVKMKEDFARIIDDILGVNYLYINSKHFTGLVRKRYYWFNWDFNYDIPEKDLKLKYIIDKLPYNIDLSNLLDRTNYAPTESQDGIITINPRKKNGKQTWQRGRVYDINGYCPTILATMNEITITKDHKTARKLTINELERLQGLPKDYTSGVTNIQRGKCLGNSWTVDVVAHIFRSLKSSNPSATTTAGYGGRDERNR